ncbi:thioredoxin-like [Crassostrea virginica]|uniref:Thioredoxin n=1 Tax=Crassostrea virginica TaxID=6565 RepID=A0A8B8CGT0_CRAVI|nr:thioredoxin-like [Crassostrea virginica]
MKEIFTQEELDDLLKSAGHKLIIIDFWATWCGPCKVIGPMFRKLAHDSEYEKDVIFASVDVDEANELAEEIGIECMPTIMFFKDGEKIDEMSGANKAKLVEKIEELRKK